MISVVMTTYNGSKYITQQLESIYYQTQMPDEVIICDDVSTDETTTLIESFIRNNNLQNWQLYKNESNKGWRRNFYYAISRAKGDVIFFSDQDDIWYPKKIEVMSRLMSKYNMGALYAEHTIIDENNDLMKERMEKWSFSGKIKKELFTKSFYTKVTMGCCMCVSRRIIDVFLLINVPDYSYDSQCARLALLHDSLWHFDKPLIRYRIHGRNNSGVSGAGSFGESSLSERKKDLQLSMRWIGMLIRKADLCVEKKFMLKQCYMVIKCRYRYLRQEKINFFTLLKYIDYYGSKDMLLGDFAYRHNINKQLGMIRWKLNELWKVAVYFCWRYKYD